jgi:adenosyl cobinamide kinase/adenosyl cobinamide phosphate guanylyltransferase
VYRGLRLELDERRVRFFRDRVANLCQRVAKVRRIGAVELVIAG